MNTGIAGEIRCIVKSKDGAVLTDTGYQKNMILNTGLDFFGGNHGTDMFAYCLVGGSSTAPKETDKTLGSFVAAHSSIEGQDQGEEPYLSGDSEYKVWYQKTYRFTDLTNVSVTEVGLASSFESASKYYLCTKALIKNTEGNPITITLKADEVLEISYRVWQVFGIADSVFNIKLTDDVGGSKDYKAKCRLAGVGSEDAEYPSKVGRVLEADTSVASASYNDFYSYAGDYGSVTGLPTISMGSAASVTLSDYVEGSFTRDMSIFFGLDDARFPVRSILVPTSMGTFQVQYGATQDDKPIPKSKNDTLTVPIRFTWSRYNGELNVT